MRLICPSCKTKATAPKGRLGQPQCKRCRVAYVALQEPDAEAAPAASASSPPATEADKATTVKPRPNEWEEFKKLMAPVIAALRAVTWRAWALSAAVLIGAVYASLTWENGWLWSLIGVGVAIAIVIIEKVLPDPPDPDGGRRGTSIVTVSKHCTRCFKEVPLSTQIGDRCPHCGVQFMAKKSSASASGGSTPTALKEAPGLSALPLLIALLAAVIAFALGGFGWAVAALIVGFIVAAAAAPMKRRWPDQASAAPDDADS